MDIIDSNNIEIIFTNENLNNLLLIDKNYFNYLISNIYSNQLLILFSFTFFTTLYCCAMKSRNNNKYTIIEQIEPVKGEIV